MSIMTTVTLFPGKHVKDVTETPSRTMVALGLIDASEAPRRFEFRDGKSDKFWEISVEDGAFTGALRKARNERSDQDEGSR